MTHNLVESGNSSVGRAQPCQGWGREFESRFPLQNRSNGWVAEWLCSGLQSRGRRFDSDPSLNLIDYRIQVKEMIMPGWRNW